VINTNLDNYLETRWAHIEEDYITDEEARIRKILQEWKGLAEEKGLKSTIESEKEIFGDSAFMCQ
jgi:hypothetical protein